MNPILPFCAEAYSSHTIVTAGFTGDHLVAEINPTLAGVARIRSGQHYDGHFTLLVPISEVLEHVLEYELAGISKSGGWGSRAPLHR